MGHIFSYTQADLIIQYNKMKGKKLLYPFCFDNNGLPTEKLGLKNGLKNQEDIINLSLDTSKDYKKLFDDINIKFSDHQYYTFDKLSQEICLMSFEDLKEKGLCYEKETEYWYCPKEKISISQSELTEDGRFERSGEKAILKKGEGWFINIMDHKPRIIDAINQINWSDDNYKNRLLKWIEKLEWDWSISRDRNYGIKIPGSNQTFDTWFISSLTPQLSWASYTGKASLNCPIFDLRYQSHDIIRTWSLYTIIKSLYHNDQIPWKNILITGHALDKKGEKISKSKGNFITPYYYINNFESNGIRCWAAQSSPGIDILIDDDMMKIGKKIQIKLKNAKKFIDFQTKKGYIGEDNSYYDKWIYSKNIIDNHFESLRWDLAYQELYQFFWNNFCDKYIEHSKKESISITLNKIYPELLEYWNIFIHL
jgi:valyl-tRNA synthetase